MIVIIIVTIIDLQPSPTSDEPMAQVIVPAPRPVSHRLRRVRSRVPVSARLAARLGRAVLPRPGLLGRAVQPARHLRPGHLPLVPDGVRRSRLQELLLALGAGLARDSRGQCHPPGADRVLGASASSEAPSRDGPGLGHSLSSSRRSCSSWVLRPSSRPSAPGCSCDPRCSSLIYVVFAMPFMYRALDAGLRAIDLKTLTEAAESLGASLPRTLFRVILPNLRVGDHRRIAPHRRDRAWASSPWRA